MKQETLYQDIIDILDEIISIIQSNETDVTWAGYKTVDEVIVELTDHKNILSQNDISRKRELEVLFAPTGPLQDISISNGWGEGFCSLANHFDYVMGKIV